MSLMLRVVGTIGVLCSIVACNSSGSSALPPTPNPSSTTITVNSATGAPIAYLSVTLSTGIANHAPSGVISTAKTSALGTVTFTNLPFSGQACVSATEASIFASYCATPFPATYTLAFP
ncbi:MAG: hypothetical protein WAK11_00190 [Candidatus Cybelea sp.]|jgi:hypothetical protein